MPRVVTLPASHPMHAGYDSGPLVPHADLVINAECDVPYYPHLDKTRGRRQIRPYRRGHGLSALSDALVPERPVDHLAFGTAFEALQARWKSICRR